ncbi:DUF6428 family protein [Parasedimentitalea huanghaiensis]|uniref:Uncharacterized protein n=1 Tax=Parasedimentitalea huanghaiensis TaxID=2682100 RepID=A0A6L6WE02_9RHOB|nr:DUF6428 family protein [Zongyanglinia huanghaiensis]MVO15471.1 hypothetical protein [Zongyanglinia huanghaiensis]
MTHETTTLNSVVTLLKLQNAYAPLVFETNEGEIGGGYHVTELKQAIITSIDCGGNIDDWRETHVQLLDGQTGEHMSVGKFAAIADKSMAKVQHLGEAPLYFEFALKNNGLRRYQIEALTPDASKIIVLLTEGRAVCKPAAAGKAVETANGCCSSNSSKSACCT